MNWGFPSSQTLAHVPIYSSIQDEIGNHARGAPSQSDGAGHVVRNPRPNSPGPSRFFLRFTIRLTTPALFFFFPHFPLSLVYE